MSLNAATEALPVPDDAFEILRDCRVFFQKQLVRLLHECEPLPQEALRAFALAVGEHYDEMAASQRRSSFDQLGGLTASKISLVGENDLEIDIRLGDFSTRLQERNGAELWRVYLRFITLLGRPDMPQADNPVGLKGIVKGMLALSTALGESHDRALERIARYEDYLTEFLPGVYAATNDFLIGRKVSAAQASIVTAPDAAVPHPSGATGASRTEDAAVTLQQSLIARHAAGGAPAGEWSGGFAASLLTQAMFGQLLTRLDELERTASTVGEGAALKPLSAATLGVPGSAPEAAAIDALAMIFEAIFEEPSLPDAIKTALSSLQIPTLRAAMLDPAFFSADAHPARQLLDKMARAAIGLPIDVSSRHPLCVHIREIASRVRAEFVNDTAVLAAPTAELEKMIAERDAKAGQCATAFRSILQRLEQSDLAEQRSRQAIDQLCMRTDLPAGIARFLREHWQRVLRQTWLESGEDSSAWREQLDVAEKLIWSVTPKAEMEERKLLARELPTMLQRLTAGMQRIAVPEAVRGEFLDTCFALQTAAMRGVALPQSAAPADNTSAARPAATVMPSQSEVRVGDHVLRIYDLAGASRGIGRTGTQALRVGEWLAFRMADDEMLCGRICHIGKEGGKLLLANPDWGFAVILHPSIADRQIKDGKAYVASQTSLFNFAAEQALRRSPKAVS